MEENNLLQIVGSVERIVYRNEDNGYTVLEIDVDGEEFTAVGVMPQITAGDRARMLVCSFPLRPVRLNAPRVPRISCAI